MKKAKKVLSFLTAAMMLGGIAVPAEPVAQLGAVMTVRAEEETVPTSGTCGENLTWEFDESTGTLTISGTGEMEDYGSILAPWFKYVYDDIEHVNIEDGVTSIGSHAFYNDYYLTSVTIPESVTSIGSSAFELCFLLTSMTIPDSVTSIGDRAFYNCGSLPSVKIPDGVTSIGKFTFQYCYSLTSVTIPDNVTSIGEGAFSICTSLTSIIIENPDCEIFDASDTICHKYVAEMNSCTFAGTIYGYENSTAQAYAEKYGYAFDTIDHAPKPVDTLGDVTGDDVINAGDAAMTLSAAAAYGATGSYGTMTKAQITAADIDGNSMVNASDAAYILQYAAMRGANGKDFDIRELVK